MQNTRLLINGSAGPQFTRERSALKDALVEFFSHSKGSSKILRLLSTKEKPVGYKALINELRFGEKWRSDSHDLPASAIRAVLSITQAAGLVRMTRNGFSITELGREVHRRIRLRRARQHHEISHSALIAGNEPRAEAALQRHNRPVLLQPRQEARSLVCQ